MYLLDTSAWIEFFIKSQEGEKVRRILHERSCYTSVASLAEIANWSMKKGVDGDRLSGYAQKLTQIVGLTPEIAFLAGELNFQRKKTVKNWGMMDSFILATSQLFSLRILTKDRHFQGLPNVELL